MRRALLLLLAAVAPFGVAFAAAGYPPPRGHVNDFYNVIDDGREAAIEQRLRDYAKATGIEIAVATVESTGDDDIAAYALGMARAWGVGDKKKNNGVLLLMAPKNPRGRQMRVEVGYGVEPDLPDAICKRLIQQTVDAHLSELKGGTYAPAIETWVNRTLDQLGGVPLDKRPADRKAMVPAPSKPDEDVPLGAILLIVLAALILFAVTASAGGGGGSGGAGDFIAGVAVGSILGGGGGGGGSSGGGSSWGGFGGGGFGGGGSSGGW